MQNPGSFVLLTRDKMLGGGGGPTHFADHHRQAHSNIDEQIFGSDEFRMYGFKIKRCNRTRSHDWTECPYAHKGEKATRRDPRKIPYSAVACPWFRNGSCPNADFCDFAHGVFEYWLHPARYRTRACNSGPFCQRKVCFFAHSPDQVRPDNKNKYSSSFHPRRRVTRPTAAPLVVLVNGTTAGNNNNTPTTTLQSSGSSSAELDEGGFCYFSTTSSPTGSEESNWTPMRLQGGSYFDGVSEFLNSLRKLKIGGGGGGDEEEQQDNDTDDRVFSVRCGGGRQFEPPADELLLPQIDWVSDLVN